MDMYQALADTNRRKIIELLAIKGELSATEISDKFDVSAPAISQHLKVLRETKLVDMEKRAQSRVYTINTSSLQDVEIWINKIQNLMEKKYKRLDALLEKMKKGGEK